MPHNYEAGIRPFTAAVACPCFVMFAAAAAAAAAVGCCVAAGGPHGQEGAGGAHRTVLGQPSALLQVRQAATGSGYAGNGIYTCARAA